MKNKIIMSLVVAVVFTALSYGAALYVGWVSLAAINWLEIFAVFTSFSCTYLCVVESRWNYPIGVITTLAYSVLFFQWGLPAVGIFNLYLVFSLIYGWFRWGPDKNTRWVTESSIHDVIPYSIFGMIVAFLMYILIVSFGAPIVYVDIFIAALSGIAQLLLDNKKLHTWHVWAIVNVFSIYLYFNSGLYLAALQYVFFLLNTIYGYRSWKKNVR